MRNREKRWEILRNPERGVRIGATGSYQAKLVSRSYLRFGAVWRGFPRFAAVREDEGLGCLRTVTGGPRTMGRGERFLRAGGERGVTVSQTVQSPVNQWVNKSVSGGEGRHGCHTV